MKRIGELSELRLALLLSAATCIGVVGSTLLDSWFVDASSERQTDVQIVEVAIGLLSREQKELSPADLALRVWAIDTINSVSDIKFSEEAKRALISGDVILGVNDLRAYGEDDQPTPPKPGIAQKLDGGALLGIEPRALSVNSEGTLKRFSPDFELDE